MCALLDRASGLVADPAVRAFLQQRWPLAG